MATGAGGVKIVSIRSPDRSQGRHGDWPQHLLEQRRFQSAPLTGARGDTSHRNIRRSRKSFNPLP